MADLYSTHDYRTLVITPCESSDPGDIIFESIPSNTIWHVPTTITHNPIPLYLTYIPTFLTFLLAPFIHIRPQPLLQTCFPNSNAANVGSATSPNYPAVPTLRSEYYRYPSFPSSGLFTRIAEIDVYGFRIGTQGGTG